MPRSTPWRSGRERIRTSFGSSGNAGPALSEAVKHLGELLAEVAVGEDFWEHWQYAEAQALAAVFEAAAHPETAALVHERAADADPEAWEEGTAASA